MHPIRTLLPNYAGQYDAAKSFNFVFLCCNSVVVYEHAVLVVASCLEFPHDFNGIMALHIRD